MENLGSNVKLDPAAQALFSKRSWNRANKTALIAAGRDWIASALPKRFTNYAISRLGYDAKKLQERRTLTREEQIAIAIGRMRASGEYQRLVTQYCGAWGGWDPSSRGPAPADVFRRWAHAALSSGKIKVSRNADGDWKTARQKMRTEALAQTRIRERVRSYAIDEYVDAGLIQSESLPIPLVNTGNLRVRALADSRPDASYNSTRGGSLTVRIPVQNAQAPVVRRTLSRLVADEVTRFGAVFRDAFTALLSGQTVTDKKGIKTFTGSTAQGIESSIFGAMTAGDQRKEMKRRAAVAANKKSKAAKQKKPRSRAKTTHKPRTGKAA